MKCGREWKEGICVQRTPGGLKGACVKTIGRSLMSAVPGVSYLVTSVISISVV